MSKAIEFLDGLLQESLMNLNTAMPCRVISYSESSRLAKIQPSFMVKDVGGQPEKLPPLEDVPVLFQRFSVDGIVKDYIPSLKSGDLVFVVFAQRALDKVLDGSVAFPELNRHHSIRDAVIIGVLP